MDVASKHVFMVTVQNAAVASHALECNPRPYKNFNATVVARRTVMAAACDPRYCLLALPYRDRHHCLRAPRVQTWPHAPSTRPHRNRCMNNMPITIATVGQEHLELSHQLGKEARNTASGASATQKALQHQQGVLLEGAVSASRQDRLQEKGARRATAVPPSRCR